MNVESTMFQIVLSEQQSRDTDYLEIAFAQAIDRMTAKAIGKEGRSPMGHRCQIVADPKDDDSVGIKELELIPDEGPSPEDSPLRPWRADRIDTTRPKQFTAPLPERRKADQVLDRYSPRAN